VGVVEPVPDTLAHAEREAWAVEVEERQRDTVSEGEREEEGDAEV
jgi:hypothetical protein